MTRSILYETIYLLKEIRSQYGDTRDCVTKKLDQAIGNLESIKSEKFSNPEIATMILLELERIFSALPEVKVLFDLLSE